VAAVLEFVHMTVKAGSEDEFVRLRADVEDVLAGEDGFISAELVRLEDGTWLDLIHWASDADAKASARRFPTLVDVQPWLQLIEKVVVMAHGEVISSHRRVLGA
jgi:antibiotic biosynthesis monooxygenase (ABM) superfamily enzyme